MPATARVPTTGHARRAAGARGRVGAGSVSETADGDAPHAATGCPFQAWSVAETLRVLRDGR